MAGPRRRRRDRRVSHARAVTRAMGPRVLITDGEERAALAACRGLAASGYRVSALARTPFAGALWSSACTERFIGPDPKRSAAAFVRRVEEILRRTPHAVAIPGSEASLLAMSRHRTRIEQLALLGLPPHEDVERSLDKVLLFRESAEAGLGSPRSVTCRGSAEAAAAAASVGFPLVVKPHRTLRSSGDSSRQQRLAVVHDEAELRAVVPNFGSPFVVQAYLEDALRFSCGGVMTADGLRGFVVAQFVRTWPTPAGAVAFGRTVAPPVDLAQRVEVLLRRMRWQGIFELEYLETADGRRHAIDLNPRVFGWLSLAVGAGTNLPAIWCDWLLGQASPPAIGRGGVHYRWEEADLAHLGWQLRYGRLRAAAAVVRPYRSVVHAQFRLRDPGPLLARALGLVADRALRIAWPRSGASQTGPDQRSDDPQMAPVQRVDEEGVGQQSEPGADERGRADAVRVARADRIR